MAEETKPAIQSTTIQGGILTQIGAVAVGIPILLHELDPVIPFLSPHVTAIITLIGAAAASVGGIVSIIGRWTSDGIPIAGVFSTPE